MLHSRLAGIAMLRGNRGDMDDRAGLHGAHRTEFQCAKVDPTARDFKGLVFPLKAGNKPSEVD
jgi:hypothetical protein